MGAALPARPRAAEGRERRFAVLAGLALVAAVVGAYADGLRGPLVLDDGPAITANASILRLWPLWGALHPPLGMSVSGRPVANLTLALNHAEGGTSVWGYHALNVAIHALAALALYGVVRRTLQLPSLAARWGKDAVPVAATVAAVWALHPLQTEAVTYVVQRVESLMGLFFLLTFYCFVRSLASSRAGWWQAGAVLACLLGMATKEVMVAAPALLFLYDRAFASGSLAGAARKRPGFYGCLAATWVLLAGLVVGIGGSRQNAAGFTGSISPLQYWWTQFGALIHYLCLAVWPHPLVFDYGPVLAGANAGTWLCAILVVGLLAAALFASWRRPALGFLGLWFFAILAPTSIVPVATQTIAEHRMYLPLAAIAVGFVLGVCALLPTGGARWLVLLPVAAALGFSTARRNLVYGSELSLWRDTVASCPENARAHCSYGLALAADPRNRDAAIAEFEAALRLHPNYSEAHLDLGNVLTAMPGRRDEAIGHYQQALAIQPDLAEAENNLGLAYAEKGEPQAAVEALTRAVRLQPQYAEAAVNPRARAVPLRAPGGGDRDVARGRRAPSRLRPGAVPVGKCPGPDRQDRGGHRPLQAGAGGPAGFPRRQQQSRGRALPHRPERRGPPLHRRGDPSPARVCRGSFLPRPGDDAGTEAGRGAAGVPAGAEAPARGPGRHPDAGDAGRDPVTGAAGTRPRRPSPAGRTS